MRLRLNAGRLFIQLTYFMSAGVIESDLGGTEKYVQRYKITNLHTYFDKNEIENYAILAGSFISIGIR